MEHETVIPIEYIRELSRKNLNAIDANRTLVTDVFELLSGKPKRKQTLCSVKTGQTNDLLILYSTCCRWTEKSFEAASIYIYSSR